MSVISTLLVKLGVDADDIEKGIDSGSKSIEAGAKKFALAGAAVGAATVAGIVGAMNVEKANDKLSAQLGLSAKESRRVGGIAGKLYADAYGENLGEVNTAVGAVMSSIDGMANASGKRLQSASAKALDFASTFEIDVTKAVSSVGTLMNSGLAKNAGQAFDLITAASQRVPAALREDVLDASDEYAQFFNTLGISGKDAFGMLVEGSKKGMYGIDKVGDAVKEFTIRSTDMSTTSTAAYDSIGLDAEKMANRILKGGKTANKATGQIIDGLLSIKNPSKQANAAIALFGTPLEDLNASEIPQFLKSLKGGGKAMDGFKGSAAEMGKTLNDNAATNLESFKRQVTTTFVNFVGGKALPVVNDIASALATGFGPAVSMVTGFLKKHQAIVGPVLVGLGTMLGIIGTIIGITKLWTMAQAALNVVLALNPIGLVIIAIAGLVAGLIYAYKKSETFRKIVNGAFSAVKGVVLGVINWFRKAVPGAIDWVGKKWTSGWNAIKSTTTRIAGAITGFVKSIPGKLVSFFLNWTLPGLIIKHWGAIKAGTIRVAMAMVTWVRGLPGRIIGGLANLGSRLYSTGTSAFGKLRSGATSKAADLMGYVRDIPGRVASALGNLGSLLYGKGADLIQGLIDGIMSKIAAIGTAMGNVAGKIKGFLPGSPVKEGPLTSWNNGAAGKRLVDLLASGLTHTSPLDRAMQGLAGGVANGLSVPGVSRSSGESVSLSGANGRRAFHIDNVEIKAMGDRFDLKQSMESLAWQMGA